MFPAKSVALTPIRYCPRTSELEFQLAVQSPTGLFAVAAFAASVQALGASSARPFALASA